MTNITITSSEFRSLRKQAKRELEAEKAGFVCHTDMVKAHRDECRRRLLARRDLRRLERVSCA